MIKEYEGAKYGIKVNYSNQFPFIAIYFFANHFRREYKFSPDIAQRLENGEDPNKIGALFEKKRGNLCL
jgi:hypothetical protein